MDISILRDRSGKYTYTVTEINEYIKNIFDTDRTLTAVSVKGEISNFTYHRSGHLYFTLKDETSQIKSVMFRSVAQKLKFMPENGMKVVVFGHISVYAHDGTYQIYANTMQPDGIGALYLAYEQLKEKLTCEGLFDEIYKKDIPKYPEKIGVITSPTGAAIKDIINVTKRRFPLAKIYLYPSLVQGDGAEENLIRALNYFDETSLVDVIIIGRGGGSIEDLWAFNSEKLARKIFAINIPVISAVGHETDFTICDFVADMRAPTPSAAAELSVPDINNILLRLDGISERLGDILVKYIDSKKEILCALKNRKVFTSPDAVFEIKREALNSLEGRLNFGINTIVNESRIKLAINTEKVNALSPLSVLSRGYAIVQKDNDLINSVSQLSEGDVTSIKFPDGIITAGTLKITKEKGT